MWTQSIVNTAATSYRLNFAETNSYASFHYFFDESCRVREVESNGAPTCGTSVVSAVVPAAGLLPVAPTLSLFPVCAGMSAFSSWLLQEISTKANKAMRIVCFIISDFLMNAFFKSGAINYIGPGESP